MLTEYQGRDLLTKVALALSADGRFLAMRTENVMNVGAHCVSLSPLAKGAGLITGSYDIPVATLRARAIFTNTVPNNVMRSSGRPEVTFAVERLIDDAAAELGFDRFELRRQNLIRPDQMPYTNAVGSIYDSATFKANMDLGLRMVDWPGFEKRRQEAAAHRKLLGFGFANYIESSTGSPIERTDITVTPQGRVEVVIGTQPSGQGHETSFAQVAADLLSVPIDNVDVILGDTDVVKEGGGSHSGRSMRHAATVISMAAPELIAQGKAFAATILGTTPAEVEFQNGRFASKITNRTFDFFELAKEAHARGKVLAISKTNEMHMPVYPNGCAACEVEVDADTGRVHITRYASVDDVGRCINPMTVDGQTLRFDRPRRGRSTHRANLPRSRLRAATHRIVHGVRGAIVDHVAEGCHPDRRSAIADQSPRHQIRQRGSHRGRASLRRQRHRGCAAWLRNSRPRHARNPTRGLAGDSNS